jgi:beta-1,2-xylosyltransferase
MLPFLSLPSTLIRERVEEVREKGSIFTLTFVPDGQGDIGTACTTDQRWIPSDWKDRGKGMVKIQGQGGWKWRCK